MIERIPAARTDEEGVAREEEAGCTAVGVSQVQTNASRRMTCNRANREAQPYAIHAPIDPYSDTDGCLDARGYGSIVRPAASAWFGCWSMRLPGVLMTDSLASAEDRSIAEPSLSAVMSTIGSPACRLTCINDASELCARRAPATGRARAVCSLQRRHRLAPPQLCEPPSRTLP